MGDLEPCAPQHFMFWGWEARREHVLGAKGHRICGGQGPVPLLLVAKEATVAQHLQQEGHPSSEHHPPPRQCQLQKPHAIDGSREMGRQERGLGSCAVNEGRDGSRRLCLGREEPWGGVPGRGKG